MSDCRKQDIGSGGSGSEVDVLAPDPSLQPRFLVSESPPAYWRSPEEYAGTSAFRQWADREFPELAMELDASYAPGGPSRRRFLQLMAASMALAGLTSLQGCRRKEERVLAYPHKTAEMIPGKAMYYATTMVLAGQPIGLLAETHEGRPTKVEGNLLHPASHGATHVFAQASILDLYDPDRSRSVLHKGQPAQWKEDFLAFIEKHAPQLRENEGRGFAVLSEDYASPALDMLREHMTQVMPKATFHVYEPMRLAEGGGAGVRRAAYDLSKAQVILSLDCDFLDLEDDGTRYRRQFAAGRRVEQPGDSMSRLYVVEPSYTVTGAAADHRLRLRASAIGAYAQRLLEVLTGSGAQTMEGVDPRWIAAVAEDLKAHRGRAIVLVGRRQPQAVHDIAALINLTLGNEANAVDVSRGRPAAGIAELASRLRANEVSTLLILGGNPVYTAPSDLQMADLIRTVPTTIRLGLYEDETSALSTWHIPAAHYLESWGDARASDRILSPIQPMIEPLFGGITPLELLARMTAYEVTDPYEIVRRSFRRAVRESDFEAAWRRFLHEGVYRSSTSRSPGAVRPKAVEWPDLPDAGSSAADGLEICFAFSSSVLDGRFANNAWLQECPDPMTKLTWDNAALLSPRTALQHQISTGDLVQIEANGQRIEIPALILPGHADGSITLTLGYGRRRVGTIGDGAGTDVYPLRTAASPGFARGAKITRTGRKYPLATTQEHWAISEHHVVDRALKQRGIIRQATLEEFRKHPDFVEHMGVEVETDPNDPKRRPLTIYAPPTLTGPQQWGMVIDLNKCIGCTACTIACQAENNIPVVGKNEVLNGREMHWMRLDRYFSGDPLGEVDVAMQPMLCQHCEMAPCEPVCPVNATVHSPEGLNEMVYNRCIGTRYCSNNCPYKVRRFNFFDYNKGTLRDSKAVRSGNTSPNPMAGFGKPQAFQPDLQEMLKLQKNPQVTIRMRGVMEKCTYCVQRIEQARIDARTANAQAPITVEVGSGVNRANAEPDGKPSVKVPEGAIQTACQQACPTQAIVFGDITDPNSQVSRLRNLSRNYQVLGHIGIRPRTTYLARLRNVNPAMPASLPHPEQPKAGEVHA